MEETKLLDTSELRGANFYNFNNYEQFSFPFHQANGLLPTISQHSLERLNAEKNVLMIRSKNPFRKKKQPTHNVTFT